MSVGNRCSEGNDRCATVSSRGGILWHEVAGAVQVNRVHDHYDFCWVARESGWLEWE